MTTPTGVLFYDAQPKPLSTLGLPQAGAYYLFFLTGTTTPTNVYADGALTVPLSQIPGTTQPSCTADSAGRFNAMYLNPGTIYRYQLFNALGAKLEDIDPYVPPGTGTQSSIGQIIYFLTAAEIASGVTPSNYGWPTLNPLRYGAVGSGLVDDHVAVQTAFTVAGAAGGTVNFPPGYTFLCSADISVPVAASSGSPLACAQGPGWGTISVIFGTGSTFGFTILGSGATAVNTPAGGAQTATYNYAGTFRDLGIQLNGTSNSAFYINSVNQPRIENCWIRGSGTNGRSVFFLNCLLPVFEDVLVTGCGSATQGSVEFDSCTTPSWRGSRISSGVVTTGGLLIDRCTNFVGSAMSIETCGILIRIGSKAEAAIPCTGVILRGLELENPGTGNPYIEIGAGLTSSALVLDVKLDGMYGSPSGSTTVSNAVKMQNVSGFEATNCFFTLGSSPTSSWELVGTNISGVFIRAHRDLQSNAVPWVRYNGTQVKAAGPLYDWQLGLINTTPVCTSKGLSAMTAVSLTGTTPSILINSTIGGFYSAVQVANAGATSMTLTGGELGMETTLYAADSNTTLTQGVGASQFITQSGSNVTMGAGKSYKFIHNGTAWSQL